MTIDDRCDGNACDDAWRWFMMMIDGSNWWLTNTYWFLYWLIGGLMCGWIDVWIVDDCWWPWLSFGDYRLTDVFVFWLIDVLVDWWVADLCTDVFMYWWIDAIMCGCIDGLLDWCVMIDYWWCFMRLDVMMGCCIDWLMCWCVELLMDWCNDEWMTKYGKECLMGWWKLIDARVDWLMDWWLMYRRMLTDDDNWSIMEAGLEWVLIAEDWWIDVFHWLSTCILKIGG